KAEEFFITAMKSGQGIRMLKQNFLEMTISFIISANNNIPRIRKTLKKITYNHGEKLDGYYAFPTLDRLLKIKEEEFKAYGAGYRARYLVATIREIAAQEENPTGYSTAYEERLKKLSTQGARKELMKLQGVGRKVADCILLFGLHRGDVFPTDIWIEKVYNDHFKMTEELDATQISAYFEKLFGEHSGYVQQCFYHYKRNLMI
ncbi:MAG: 8-oxoguanine DNA glycosylase, partial [Firmicutes bacterium]|nr:8-oxoguanine DNA glycosylase [Bacillota bacterium]